MDLEGLRGVRWPVVGRIFASLTMYPPVSFTYVGPLCTSILQPPFLPLALGSPGHCEPGAHGSRGRGAGGRGVGHCPSSQLLGGFPRHSAKEGV